MKYNLLLIFAIVWAIMACDKPSRSVDLVLRNVNVVDVDAGIVVEGQDVSISRGRIAKIANHDSSDESGSKAVDATGKFLMPGLIDMHAHAIQDFDYQYALPLCLAYGVTTIRDPGGQLDLADSLRSVKEICGLPPPRIFLAGGILGGNPARNGTSIATVEEGIKYVDLLAENGADFIKTYEYLYPEIYQAILKRSAELNLDVCGHPPKLLGLLEGVTQGQRSIEHLSQISFWCTPYTDVIIDDMRDHWYGPGVPMSGRQFDDTLYNGFSELMLDSISQVMIDLDVHFCPTVMVYENLTYPWRAERHHQQIETCMNPFRRWFWEDDLEWAKNNFLKDSIGWMPKLERRKYILSKFIKKGVPIMAGTDAGVSVHGINLHRELEIYVECGMSNRQALQSATTTAVDFLHMGHDLGKIKEGYLADLLLLNGNPLEDIRNTRKIEAVVANGNYLGHAVLDAALSGLKTKFERVIIDTLKIALLNDSFNEVRALIDNFKQYPKQFYLGGGQFTLLAFQKYRAGNDTQALDLLKEEIRHFPKTNDFAWMSIVEHFNERNMTDSALHYAKMALEIRGPTFLNIQSKIRRLEDPTYGLLAYRDINAINTENIEGVYTSGNDQSLVLSRNNDTLVLKLNDEEIILNPQSDTAFYFEGSAPERVVVRRLENAAIQLFHVRGRDVTNYHKAGNND